MFDIGWTELIVVAVVMILVVGPKDLPRMLRTFGQTIGKVRRMAGEFQSTFNEALREAEQQADIADMKKQVEKAANFDPLGDIKKSIETDFKTPKPAPKKPAETAGQGAPVSAPAGENAKPGHAASGEAAPENAPDAPTPSDSGTANTTAGKTTTANTAAANTASDRTA